MTVYAEAVPESVDLPRSLTIVMYVSTLFF